MTDGILPTVLTFQAFFGRFSKFPSNILSGLNSSASSPNTFGSFWILVMRHTTQPSFASVKSPTLGFSSCFPGLKPRVMAGAVGSGASVFLAKKCVDVLQVVEVFGFDAVAPNHTVDLLPSGEIGGRVLEHVEKGK